MSDKGNGCLIDRNIIVTSFSIQALAQTKRFALRRGIWYRILNRIERATIDLTVRYVDNVKSSKLAKMITAIVDKLQTAMQSRLDRLVGTVGVALTIRISETAIKWGNKNAHSWTNDLAFARFLVVNYGKLGVD